MAFPQRNTNAVDNILLPRVTIQHQEMDTEATFQRDYYSVARSFLKEPRLSQAYRYARKLAHGQMMSTADSQVPDTPSSYGDWVMEGLLSDLQPAVEALSGVSLFPTYAYFRVYKSGDILKKHKDRPSCEISVTACLGYTAPKPWPIRITGPQGSAGVELEPGDAMLYRGTECYHWREPFEGEHIAQVFLHYVDRNGPRAEWKFDKRAGLSIMAKLAGFPISVG